MNKNLNKALKNLKDVITNQTSFIVTKIVRFRDDKALSYRPLVKIGGKTFTLCMSRKEDNRLEVIFTDANDQYLYDSMGFNISSSINIPVEYKPEDIEEVISNAVAKLVFEYFCC